MCRFVFLSELYDNIKYHAFVSRINFRKVSVAIKSPFLFFLNSLKAEPAKLSRASMQWVDFTKYFGLIVEISEVSVLSSLSEPLHLSLHNPHRQAWQQIQLSPLCFR